MKDIINTPTKNDALIRVYKAECRINAAASRLLHLSEYNLLRVTTEEDGGVYISSCPKGTPCAFKPNKRGSSYRVYSVALCNAFAEHLDGYGIYRISCDQTLFVQNKVYYKVIKQKY